jgi:DNA-binding transcriptional LysR family regulator
VNADPKLTRLGPMIAWLRERHPLLDVNVEMRSSLATRQGVRAGELDAGFLLGSSIDSGLTGLALAELDYRVAAPRAWAERVRTADWKALASLPWVVTAAGTSNQEMREALFRPHGVEPAATVEANNDLLLRTLIAEGIGLGLVREDHALQGERDGVYVLAPIGQAHTRLLFVHPIARADDPVIHALTDSVRAQWPHAQSL